MPHPPDSPPQPRTRPRRATGFTLVELTIVVLILSILAAIVLPQITAGSDESRSAACATTAKSVETKLAEYYAKNSVYPATIDANWFAEKRLPVNPWDLNYAGTTVWVDNTATDTQTHPALKHIRNLGTFWYNPKNGRFRALVPAQATDDETLAIYNQSNAAACPSINAIIGG